MKSALCHPEREYHAKGMCKACYGQAWSEANRDKTREAQRKCKSNNPERWNELRKIAYLRNREQKRTYHKMRNSTPDGKRRTKSLHLLKRYGIGIDAYDRLFAVQGGACAICGDKDGFGGRGHNLRVDHDHSNSQVRGLLCNRCNTGLGYLENESWYEKAAEYLAKHHPQTLRLIRGQNGS